MPWLRLDSDLDQHPDLLDAPPFALDTFIVVLRVVKAHGWGGKVDVRWTQPRYLLRRLLWPADMVEQVTTAFDFLVAVGWLDQDAEKTIVPKWSKFQSDPTNADRQARHRAAKQAKPSKSNGVSRQVTGGNASNDYRTLQDETETNPPNPPCEGGSRQRLERLLKCLNNRQRREIEQAARRLVGAPEDRMVSSLIERIEKMGVTAP